MSPAEVDASRGVCVCVTHTLCGFQRVTSHMSWLQYRPFPLIELFFEGTGLNFTFCESLKPSRPFRKRRRRPHDGSNDINPISANRWRRRFQDQGRWEPALSISREEICLSFWVRETVWGALRAASTGLNDLLPSWRGERRADNQISREGKCNSCMFIYSIKEEKKRH